MVIGDTKDLGENVDNPSDRYKLEPKFVLSGILENDSIFVPHDCICRTEHDNGEMSLILPNTADDFYACILYADAAFRALILEEDMELKKLAFYLEPSQIKVAKYEYNIIKYRTPLDLRKYIVENSDNQTLGLPPSPFDAPPMLQ